MLQSYTRPRPAQRQPGPTERKDTVNRYRWNVPEIVATLTVSALGVWFALAVLHALS